MNLSFACTYFWELSAFPGSRINTVLISVPVDRQTGWGETKSFIREGSRGKAKIGGWFRATSKVEKGFYLVDDWPPRAEVN